MYTVCPNIKSAEWRELNAKFGEDNAWKIFIANGNRIPTIEDINKLSNVDQFKRIPNIDYQLRIVDTLVTLSRPKQTGKSKKYNTRTEAERISIKLNDRDHPYREINLRKTLNNKGVPNSQVDFMFNYMRHNNISEMSSDELAIELASLYSYMININTSTESVSYVQNDYGFESYGAPESTNVIMPTSHYAYLTAPGGVNYREREISTPMITPIIKGHPEFATNNGIGWIRVDESLGSNIEGDEYYNADYLTQGEEMGIANLPNESEINRRKANAINTLNAKSLRVLEVQSDLFQKGRSMTTLIKPIDNYRNITDYEVTYDDGDNLDYLESLGWVIDSLEDGGFKLRRYLGDNPNVVAPSNSFIQLLNTDNNWVTFFIKSIIQNAAKEGYESVYFPRGETAANIEGHQTITNELKAINAELMNTENAMKFELNDGTLWNIDDGGNYFMQTNDGYIQEVTEAEYLEAKANPDKKSADRVAYLKQRRNTLKSEGFAKLKPIEAFYEVTVGNILTKAYGNAIENVTDEYNNKWRKLTIDPNRDLATIKLSEVEDSDIATPSFGINFDNSSIFDNYHEYIPYHENRLDGYDIDRLKIVVEMLDETTNDELFNTISNLATDTKYSKDSKFLSSREFYSYLTDIKVRDIRKSIDKYKTGDRFAGKDVLTAITNTAFGDYVDLIQSNRGRTKSEKTESYFTDLSTEDLNSYDEASYIEYLKELNDYDETIKTICNETYT